MTFYKRKSIRKTLMLVLLLTSSSALVLATLGFAINDRYSLRAEMIARLHSQAGIIGNNSIAALVFGDAESAEATLASLRGEAYIVSATLFNRTGKPFATYRRDGESTPPKTLPASDSGAIDNALFVMQPVLLDHQPVGNIVIVSRPDYWQSSQRNQLFTLLGLFVLSLCLSAVVSARLQRVVTKPILKLAATARQITLSRDYSLRAKKLSKDEIGHLVEDFNGMLEQIQLRDSELQRSRELLEQKVEERTQELTELTRELEHQAYHDMLTGLANRITFDNHLSMAISDAQRSNRRVATLFLDLDRFKVINDTLGHPIGDKLLIEIARRLSLCLRKSDTLARLGGDEFAVLLLHSNPRAAEEVAHKIIASINEPIIIDGYNLHMSTSIGISLYPDDGATAAEILKNSDTAMYRSKDSGRNRYTFFTQEMNTRATRRLNLENKLRAAIRHNRLSVYYQPKRDAETLRLVGVEALVRWFDPEEDAISPSEFIPLANECGLVSAIDEWVMETACREVLSWFRGATPDISLSVNLSPANFIRKDLSQVIANILAKTGFNSQRLELEITEDLFGPNTEDSCSVLKDIQQLGVEISIDDFGIAYSSLSRLKQLPLHTLKIDQSFIRDLGQDPDDEIIVKTIINMAHSMNLKVVAEGVETPAQLDFVKRNGCDTVQGYLLGRPAPGAEIQNLLAARRQVAAELRAHF